MEIDTFAPCPDFSRGNHVAPEFNKTYTRNLRMGELLQEIEVQAQADHLDFLTKARPLSALCELIWNAYDADATNVEVKIAENSIEGIEEIQVIDNGEGIQLDQAQIAFGYLGGSWKKISGKTHLERRILHGKEGKGRFKAFALGSKIVWTTVFRNKDQRLLRYRIEGDRQNLKKFRITPPEPVSAQPTGTIVVIGGVTESFGMLSENGKGFEELSENFAIYLRDYPHVKLHFRGKEISPSAAQKDFKEYSLDGFEVAPGETIEAKVQIVEWTTKRDRKLCLCDAGGFTLHEMQAGVRPGSEFQFTAYLRSPFVAELHKNGLLELEELEPRLKRLLDGARETIRLHFREKRAKAAAELVSEWKDEGNRLAIRI
jgi:hypothetical protein